MKIRYTLFVTIHVVLLLGAAVEIRAEKADGPDFDDALAEIVTTLEAGSGEEVVRHWAPSSPGSVRVVGHLQKLSCATEATFQVLADGKTVWSKTLGATDSVRHGFDVVAYDLTEQSTAGLRVIAGSGPVRVQTACQIVPEPFLSRWAPELPTGYPAWREEDREPLRRKGQAMLQAIRDASRAERRQVVIPPGDYLMHADWSRASTLSNLADLEITAEGVTFWFEPPHVHALLFQSCRNVTVRGLDIDFTSPVWFQARVAEIDRKKGTIRAVLMKGYKPRDAGGQMETSGERMLVFYAADGRYINHGPSPGKWRLLEDGHTVVCDDIRRFGIPDALQPGSYLVGTIRTGAALRSSDCSGMRFEDVNIWSSPGMALYEGGGEGGHVYLRVRATRRPRTNRLHAFGADVFHMAATDRGPTLDRCESAYGSDDNLNIHGNFGRVVQGVDDRGYYMQGAYAVGDALEFRDPETMALLGTAKVVSARETSNGPSLTINAKHNAKGEFFLELDTTLVLPALSLVVLDRKRSSRGWVVRNCWFHDNLQRTLINGAPGGLFENTTLQNVGMGIRVQFETWGPWMEGPFARDLVIRNSRFLDAPPSGPAVAVSMHPPGGGSDRRRFDAVPVTDMTIAGNYFARTSGTPLNIHNVGGLRIHGNHIDYNGNAPLPAGLDDASGVNWLYLQDCTVVSLEENRTPVGAGNE